MVLYLLLLDLYQIHRWVTWFSVIQGLYQGKTGQKLKKSLHCIIFACIPSIMLSGFRSTTSCILPSASTMSNFFYWELNIELALTKPFRIKNLIFKTILILKLSNHLVYTWTGTTKKSNWKNQDGGFETDILNSEFAIILKNVIIYTKHKRGIYLL